MMMRPRMVLASELNGAATRRQAGIDVCWLVAYHPGVGQRNVVFGGSSEQ